MNKLSNKLFMFSILKEDKAIIKYLPITEPYSRKNCLKFLKKHGVAILKPEKGSSGRGIIKVSLKDKYYTIATKSKTITLDRNEDLLPYLEKQMNNKPYIIQQYIDRVKINDRFFDIRVLLQKKNNSNWKLTGWFGQLSSKASFLSNISAGGSIVPFDESLKNQLKELTSKEIIIELQRVALSIVEHLGKQFPKKHLWGFDLGINNKGQILLIEVSTKPNLSKFKNKKLDAEMFKNINSYL
ncbi:YheC/YheD family protein [Natronincola ferrireducens]|nr:YheC/YheD family protein [Natronincola ferrireducens]